MQSLSFPCRFQVNWMVNESPSGRESARWRSFRRSTTRRSARVPATRRCRAAAWRCTDLLKRLDELLQEWAHDDFVHSLPELRLAFADLTPRETDIVAGRVATLHGESDLGDLVHYDISEADLAAGIRLNETVAAILQRDGLSVWVAEPHNE